MIRNVQRKWFEIWGEEQAQNKLLKGLLVLFTTLLIGFSTSTCYLATKAPILISVSPKDTRLLAITNPNQNLLEQEIENTLKSYLTTRHTWTPKTIEQAAQKASLYIQSSYKKKYKSANKNQILIAKKRKVSQKMYVYSLELNQEKQSAIVKVDRILDINGVRSSRSMTFEMKYTFGARHSKNPEGIYVTDENLINSIN